MPLRTRFGVCIATLLVMLVVSCRIPTPTLTTTELAVAPGCTPAPTAPPKAPSDWAAVVHSNCFDDLDRLGQWVGGTEALRPGESPEDKFTSVAPGSISGTNTEVVVLAHGWAPGYRQAVDNAGGKLLWWNTRATNADGVYASDWAWIETAVNTSSVTVCVSKTGFFQQLDAHFQAHNTKGVVLGFSWLDHSATGGSFLDLTEVYRSEAYTNIAGIRLANALEAALASDFWMNTGNRLHIIGHSHGSKVATVAALILQQRGKRVDHLTILDSPESEITLEGNGANLLGFYLEQMQIANPTDTSDRNLGAFVDNHASFFGVNYDGLDNVVDVNLEPGALYSVTQPGEQHSYAAAWYAGAAAAVDALKLKTPLGLDWPPPPKKFKQALNQDFTAASHKMNLCRNADSLDKPQWQLTAGSPRLDVFGYSTASASIEFDSKSNVTCFPSCDDLQRLTFPSNDGTQSVFRGGYDNSIFSDGYGLAFDVTWSGAMAGDYLVATVDAPEEGQVDVQEVILILDGRSKPNGTYPVAFNADISSEFFDVDFAIYLIPASGSQVEVTVANFRRVLVSGL